MTSSLESRTSGPRDPIMTSQVMNIKLSPSRKLDLTATWQVPYNNHSIDFYFLIDFQSKTDKESIKTWILKKFNKC